MAENKKIEKQQSAWSLFVAGHRSEVTMGGALIVLIVVLCIIAPNFLSTRNFTNIMSQVGFTAILALGQTFVMLTGGIDLSVGSVLGITSMVAAMLMRDTQSVVLALIVALLLGAFIGTVNGTLVSRFRIPAFVVTLGMMQICRSGDYLLSGGHGVSNLPDSFRAIAGAELFKGFRVYYIFIIVLFIVIHWVLSNTKLGRFTYAIGSNETATRLAGVNTRLYTLLPYIISGTMAAIGGILMGSRFSAVDPNFGTNYEMNTLAAVVIGGCAMTGGKGTILGTAIGVLFMGVLSNGLDISGVSPYWQGVATGTVLIIALLVDHLLNRKANG